MSKETIVRLNEENEDIEYAQIDNLGNISFKKMKSKEFVDMVNIIFSKKNEKMDKKISILEDGVIGADVYHVLIKQPEHKKIVTYAMGNVIKTYKINFPNCLYIIQHDLEMKKIVDIECYAYKEFKGENTQLFEYPMPNELSANRMCIGNADRSIKKGKFIDALERIIFTSYSHSTFSGINGFSQTQTYFLYLEQNEFPYKMLKPLKKKLKDVLHG